MTVHTPPPFVLQPLPARPAFDDESLATRAGDFLAEVEPFLDDAPGLEKPVFLLVVGHPKPGCQVPVHSGLKKPLDAIATWLD